MISSVSSVSGMSGDQELSSVEGNFAHVAHGAHSRPSAPATSVRMNDAHDGDGIAVVMRGRRYSTDEPGAPEGVGDPAHARSAPAACAMKIRIASRVD